MKKGILLVTLALALLTPLSAQKQPKYNVAFYGQLPLDVMNGFALGGFLEYRGYKSFGFMLDLEFYKSYYNYQGDEWYGPVSWLEVDSSGVAPWDWIFYQWNCQVHLFVNWYIPSLSGRVTPYIGAGPTINLIFPAESNDNYPEFNEYYEEQKRDLALIPGLAFRAGAEMRLLPGLLFGGAGIKVRFDDFKNMGRDIENTNFGIYMLGHSHIYVYLMLGF
jgi:hypothetical protein